jgi:hypothetical protein
MSCQRRISSRRAFLRIGIIFGQRHLLDNAVEARQRTADILVETCSRSALDSLLRDHELPWNPHHPIQVVGG